VHRALEATPIKIASMRVDRAILDREPGGLAKEEAKKGSDGIPGVTIVAAHADHMICEAALAILHLPDP